MVLPSCFVPRSCAEDHWLGQRHANCHRLGPRASGSVDVLAKGGIESAVLRISLIPRSEVRQTKVSGMNRNETGSHARGLNPLPMSAHQRGDNNRLPI